MYNVDRLAVTVHLFKLASPVWHRFRQRSLHSLVRSLHKTSVMHFALTSHLVEGDDLQGSKSKAGPEGCQLKVGTQAKGPLDLTFSDLVCTPY